jgi:oxygen-dependent protoporphyrinogen oxidase
VPEASAGDRRPLVVVIGGGVSGLAAARALAGLAPVSEGSGAPGVGSAGAGIRVVLIEEADRLGGKVASGQLAGVDAELGPDQFLRRDPSAERLCRHLGLGEDLHAPNVTGAAVYSHGELRPLPAGLVLGIPTDLDALGASGVVTERALERARADMSLDGPALTAGEVGLDTNGEREPQVSGDSSVKERPDWERSAGEILRARLGDETVDRLVDPLLGGINAGSVDHLSLGTVAPQVARALVGHRDVIAPLSAYLKTPQDSSRAPGFFGVTGGLGRVVAACESELRRAGVEIRTRTAVVRAGRSPSGATSPYTLDLDDGERLACNGIVVAVPAPQGASLVAELGPAAARELAAVAYSSVAVLTVAYRATALSPFEQGTGLLVPRVEGTIMTAATWLSAKWPWMASETLRLVRVSAGRSDDGRISGMGDDELACELMGELEKVTGLRAEPEGYLVTRWPRSFPQYEPGHRTRMERVSRSLSFLPGVALAGAVLGGIGIPACISSGEAAGRRVASGLTGGRAR